MTPKQLTALLLDAATALEEVGGENGLINDLWSAVFSVSGASNGRGCVVTRVARGYVLVAWDIDGLSADAFDTTRIGEIIRVSSASPRTRCYWIKDTTGVTVGDVLPRRP